MGFCAVGPPHKGLYGGGTILGKLDGQIVRVVKEKTAPPTIENAVWVAEPQKGKTTCGIIPNIIAAAEAGESLVITDPKGELTRLMYGYLKSKGYDVYVFNLDQPELGNCWNLVAECQDEEEISGAVETLVVNGQVTADKSGGYWLSKETQLLESLIYLLKADFPIEQQHLSSALSLAVWPEKVLNARFTTAYQEGRLPKVGFDSWQGTRTANLENAVSGLTAKLKVLRSGKIADLISKQEIDFTSIGKKKAALFCILPIGATHLKPVLSSFYYFFFRRLYALAQESGGRLPNPTRFLLDEFANIGQIGANFPETISTGPGLGITIQIVLQSVAQLYPTYGKDFATAILSCCPIKFWLGGTDKESARFFSDNLGTAAVYGESQKRDVTMHLTRRLKPNIKTESIVSRQLMEPYELGQDVKMDDEVVVISGSYPVRCKKMQWTELPQAAEINAINDSIREEKGINAGGRIKLEHLIAKNNNKAVTPDYPMGGDGDQGGHDAKMHSGRPPQKRGSEEVSIIRKIKPLDTIDDDDSIDDGTANNLGLK
jgi:type IV secretion system protein VirD4